MRETIAGVVAAGAFALSPHPMEQPAALTPAQVVQPEHPGAAALDSDPQLLPHPDNYQNLAISEFLDPDTVAFWIELGIGTIGLTGVGGFVTSRRLRKSLRKDHLDIQANGWEAQNKLNTALVDAKQQAAGLREDDAPKLRELIASHSPTSDILFGALASTGPEFTTEHDRLFPRKRRLHKAPDTKLVIGITKPAKKQAKELQAELDRVRTELTEIDTNINRADSTVSSLSGDLAALTQRGWDVSTYQQRAEAFTESVATARAKRNENYLDEPTKLAKATTQNALELQEKAAALESRRAAADEAYGAQSGRATTARATAETARGHFAKLQDTYNDTCLVNFENLPDKLTQALEALASVHNTGGSFTGQQGMSVEAIDRSEALNQSFDTAFGEVQTMEEELRKRQEHLAALTIQLPRKINKLSAQFDKAIGLTDDPDVESDTATEIVSFTDDVASLSTNISTAEGQKPDYLDIEKHHQSVAKEFNEAYDAATKQKQEMNDLRTDIPELTRGYNDLVASVKSFANQRGVRLQAETRQGITELQNYELTLAADRNNLRKQRKILEKRVKHVHGLMEQAKEDSDEDSPLLVAAKIVGVTALAVIGLDILD